MTEAENISMTPAEFDALVTSRMAERDAEREREAERIRQLYNPTPTPVPPRPQASPELMAEFNKALDVAKGNVDEAFQAIARRLNVDVYKQPVDPDFYRLYHDWAGNLKPLLEIMMRRRSREKAGV